MPDTTAPKVIAREELIAGTAYLLDDGRHGLYCGDAMFITNYGWLPHNLARPVTALRAPLSDAEFERLVREAKEDWFGIGMSLESLLLKHFRNACCEPAAPQSESKQENYSVHLNDILPGDRVFVNAPSRNIGDARPLLGAFVVVESLPRHTFGPCFMIRDRFGDTTVKWDDCLTMNGIAQLSAERDSLEKERDAARAERDEMKSAADHLSDELMAAVKRAEKAEELVEQMCDERWKFLEVNTFIMERWLAAERRFAGEST